MSRLVFGSEEAEQKAARPGGGFRGIEAKMETLLTIFSILALPAVAPASAEVVVESPDGNISAVISTDAAGPIAVRTELPRYGGCREIIARHHY